MSGVKFFKDTKPYLMNQPIEQNIYSEFKAIINLQYKKFYQHACIQLGNTDLAKDIVQETFLSAYENLSSFQRKSSLETWIFGILNNKILMYHRQKQSERNIIEEDVEKILFKRNGKWKKEWIIDEDEIKTHETKIVKFLLYCLNALKNKHKQIFLLKFYLNKKTEDVCALCGVSRDNFWQILHRSKLQLKVCIQSKLKTNND